MLDVFDVPKPQNGFVSVFPGFANANTQWVPWEKPAGIAMVRIVCIGGGAGGGSGFPSATTNARGGGGGGGSGGITTVEIPAPLLPDILYVSAGIGGNGAASSTTVGLLGTSGIPSYVSTQVLQVQLRLRLRLLVTLVTQVLLQQSLVLY